MERRELLKIAAVAATAGRLAEAQGQHHFFTAEEFAMVDELMEIVIPADDHSPGARAAECAAFLDGRLAEEPDKKVPEQKVKDQWHAGLRQVDQLSLSLNGSKFMETSPAGRTAVVDRMSQAPEGEFFRLLKDSTIRVYYTSKIGIHQEMEYKGNVLLNEFVGIEPK